MRILIVNGNPDPAAERLTAGLAMAYADGATTAGHEVRRIDVGSLSFPFLRSAAIFGTPSADPDIIASGGAWNGLSEAAIPQAARSRHIELTKSKAPIQSILELVRYLPRRPRPTLLSARRRNFF